MEKGIEISVSKVANGFKVYHVGDEALFYPTKKSLLSAIDKHFEEKRHQKGDPRINLVEVAHQAAGIGEVKP